MSSAYDKYVRGKILGKGSFGQAVLVSRRSDGKQFVIKEIDISRMPKAEREQAEQEAKLLMALNHPNIVRCLECFTHQSKLCIVMDWCSEGDLYNITQKRRGAPLPEDTLLDWFVQMCLGLKHVHDRKILHRDIKTQNIFMSAGGLLKLGDFGVSKILNSTWQLAATAVGTPYYLSPEICQNRRYNQKSDIWSLGCVLYELAVGRHAFEAPNMRALIQKIIKGQYTPVPATRSKELRDMIDRMLTLSWEKRPSINDILALPVMKQRITKFLSATLQAHEFSHTIIHGKPERGQIVVQPKSASAPAPDKGDAKLAAALPPPALPPAPAPGAPPGHPFRAPQAPAAPAALQPRVAAQAPGRAPSPAAPPAQGGGAGSRPSSGNAQRKPVAAPVAAAAAAANHRAQQAAAAAKQGAVAAAKEREEVAAAAAAAAGKRRDEDVRRQQAAIAAQREMERMRLEEQRKKIEAERQRLEGERKKAELARLEAERKAKLLEEAQRRAAADEERKRAEVDARKRRAEEEARKRDTEKAAREREREEMRAKMAAHKREYYDRQQEAHRNRAAVEQQLQNGAQPPVQVYEAPAPRQRRQWSPPRPPEDAQQQQGRGLSPQEEARLAAKPGQGAGLTPGQRRAVWEERKAGLERNRRQAEEAERQGGGLAAFLGVPGGEEWPSAQHKAGAGVARALSPEERARLYQEQRAAAERNRRQAEQDGPGVRPVTPVQQQQPASRPAGSQQQQGQRQPAGGAADMYDRRRRKLEAEAVEREAQILEFQRAHWREMREAAARNRAQIMAEVNNVLPSSREGQPQQAVAAGAALRPDSRQRQQQPSPAHQQASAAAAGGGSDEEADLDFAAMVKDMQDILTSEAGAAPAVSADSGDEDEEDDKYAAALEGRFLLNGAEVPLPVRDHDSLAHKVEALRMYLEHKLGTDPFLKVYRRLESLSLDDDESEVSREFLAILGAEKLAYLQLIHQLIVCEENLNSSC